MGDPIAVHGFAEPGFSTVVDAFEANFTHHGDIGAAVCVYHRGRPVVDIWGGYADRERGHHWERDTVQLVFSTTKGMVATCVHLLVERGVLDLDAPVARYWPEFAAAGKDDIPLRWVLTHQAGLAAVTGRVTLEDVLGWNGVVDAIARQAPVWEPGTAHGYHARSFGWILGEVVRRVTGRSLGRFFAEEVAGPLDLDFFIGLPAEELARVSHVYPPVVEPAVREVMDAFMGPDTMLGQVLAGPSNLFGYDDMWNRPDVLSAEMPSSNGVGTARAIARMYAALIGEVDGIRLLRADTLADAVEVRVDGPDHVIGVPMSFGLGYMTPPPFGPPGSFGHMGAGGSIGIADPARNWSMGYVMNRMDLGITGDARSSGLIAAVLTALDEGSAATPTDEEV
ncbi:MAG: serine hydrolase domain-containing protein [Microthrixaceae bacterium]